jgi:hypothetical protein
MSLIDLSERRTESYKEFQQYSSSSDSMVFIQGLTQTNDLPASIDLCVGDFWFDCREETLFAIPAEGVELIPRMSAVLQTQEKLALPKNVYGILSGKGSLIFRLLTRNCKSHRFTRLFGKRRVGFLWRPGVALSGAGR